jgi:predicted extracellular nuclease
MTFINNLSAFRTILIVILFTFSCRGNAQKDIVHHAVVAFYNLENLFDTIDDPAIDDAEFLPDGANKWTTERYNAKLSNMARAIAEIGSDMVTGGPVIIGLAEVENLGVIQDLVHTSPLKELGYQIVHYDSPDERGIDVALLYKPSHFEVINSTSNRLVISGEPDFYTRNQLVVSGKLDGEQINVIVNHWPSRRSGPEYRAEAAKLCRHLSDSITGKYKNAKNIIMGDLNDDPADSSVLVVLGAKGIRETVKKGDLFNPMWQLHHDGNGSLTYKGNWNLFDQLIVSEPLISAKGKGWKYDKAAICKSKYLFEQDGKYAGNPLRTFVGSKYLGGYSDHLPTFLILKK